jgi:hypothetical protein
MAKNDLSLFSYQVRLRSTPIPQFKVTQIRRQASGALLYVLRIQDVSTVTATWKTTSGMIVTHGG